MVVRCEIEVKFGEFELGQCFCEEEVGVLGDSVDLVEVQVELGEVG